MTVKKILAPLTLTIGDEKSLEFIINRYARDRAVQIILFHAYTPVPEIEMRNNPIMEKMTRNLSYQRAVLNDQKAALARLKERLLARGFIKDQVICQYTAVKFNVANDIVKLARKEAVDAIVLSRRPGRVTRFFTGSISRKVSNSLEKDVDVFILT